MSDAIAKREIPEATLVVVKGDQIMYSKAFGMAEIASSRAMLGFNAEGTWIWIDRVLYLWNAKDRSQSVSLIPPAGPLQLPDPPGEETQAPATPPPPAPTTTVTPNTPHAEDVKFTKELMGRCGSATSSSQVDRTCRFG